VLLATGMVYRLPGVPGIDERWGHSVFHCPFCHGWEVRDQTLAVPDSGPTGAVRPLLLRGWTDHVTPLTDGPAALDPADIERLGAAGIAIDQRRVAGLRGRGTALDAIEFADGDDLACQALLAAVTLHRRSGLADELGVASSQPGPVVVDAVAVDSMFHTTVPGDEDRRREEDR
jgi:thioredoxin reductase